MFETDYKKIEEFVVDTTKYMFFQHKDGYYCGRRVANVSGGEEDQYPFFSERIEKYESYKRRIMESYGQLTHYQFILIVDIMSDIMKRRFTLKVLPHPQGNQYEITCIDSNIKHIVQVRVLDRVNHLSITNFIDLFTRDLLSKFIEDYKTTAINKYVKQGV